MTTETPLRSARTYRPARLVEHRGVRLAAVFSDVREEYEAARGSVGLVDRNDRALLRLTGRDCKEWLHNLVTNAVRPLEPGQGCYAMACDVKGRVQFDLNILAGQQALWLDIDRATAARAIEHLSRYLITEDVHIEPVTEGYVRIGVTGPGAAEALRTLGLLRVDLPVPGWTEVDASWGADSAVMPAGQLPGGGDPAVSGSQNAGPDHEPLRVLRSDFAGLPGYELIVPAARRPGAPALWDWLVERVGARPVGLHALDILRIEAAIPWMGRDLDEKVLPPETGLAARAISYHKGCYLGQEVIERMRSHNILARRLVRLSVPDGQGLELPAPLYRQGVEVGRVTSLVPRFAGEPWIGLGYLSTRVTDASGIVVGEEPRPVSIRD